MSRFYDLIGHAPTSYRGCENVQMKFNGITGDPDIIWNKYIFNYWDVESALWSDFLELTRHKDSESGNPEVEEEFSAYVRDNIEGYLSDCIAFGYFKEGSHDWRDNLSPVTGQVSLGRCA